MSELYQLKYVFIKARFKTMMDHQKLTTLPLSDGSGLSTGGPPRGFLKASIHVANLSSSLSWLTMERQIADVLIIEDIFLLSPHNFSQIHL